MMTFFENPSKHVSVMWYIPRRIFAGIAFISIIIPEKFPDQKIILRGVPDFEIRSRWGLIWSFFKKKVTFGKSRNFDLGSLRSDYYDD